MRLKKGFISVNKLLPDLYENVLVLTKYGNKLKARRTRSWHSLFFRTDDNQWAGPVIGWKKIVSEV